MKSSVIVYKDLQNRDTDLEKALAAAGVEFDVFYASENAELKTWAHFSDNDTWPKLYVNFELVTVGSELIKNNLIK